VNDIYRIVHLYRQIPKYDCYTYERLVTMITPSLNLDQYQIHRVGNQDVGYTNWAFLNDIVEHRYKLTGKLKANEWNCGKNIWVIGVIAKSHAREIMTWTKEYFKPKLEVNESIKWIRSDDNFNIYRRSEKFKRQFHVHAQ
jgi:hemolysin-activating ACP:hemolysin acyltransferase